MNGPTKSAILDADQSSYHGLLEHLKSVAAHHESTVSRMNTSVQKPGGTYWSGATAEAAEANTHSGWKTTAAAEDIIEKYRTTAVPLIDHTIVPELTNARTIIENVESQRDKGVSCSEDLKLTYTPVPGTSEKLIEENTRLVETRQAELTKSANAWFSGCQQVAQLVATARKELDTVYDGATGTFDINKALAATAPPATPNSTVKPNGIVGGLEHLAAPDPNGEPGATKAAGAAGVETPGNFYKDWYPKAVDVGDKNVDPSKLGGVGAVPGVRDVTDKTTPQRMSPTLKPQDVPAFKEMTREVLQRQGVPADQIEARVNKAVEQAQTPHFLPDAPSASPSEHVSRDFGEQWNKFFANASDGGSKAGDAILDEGKKLTGLAGPGAPGVAEAWGALAKDTAKGLWDYTTMTPQERLEMLGNEAQRAADNPGGYLGEKLVQGAAGAATGAVGGEAAAGLRGLVGDLTHTPHPEIPGGAGHAGGDVPGHHPSPGGDHTPGAVAAEHAVGPLRSADDILHEARDSHRAIRDQMDWDRGEQNLQDLATHHGVSVDELPRTPQYDIHHPTYTDKLGPEHSAEIDRHTQLWEHGFNTQSVQQVLDHMEADRPSTTGLRDELRQGLTRYGAEDLMDAGYSPMEADRLAKAYANEQFPRDSGLIPQPATHNPDGAIGGYPNALTYGDWQVNNALGTLTKQEKDAFRAWLQTQDPNAIVNINLGRK